MSSERSISPDPLPRSHSRSSVANDEKESNGHNNRQPSSSVVQKRRRDNSKYRKQIFLKCVSYLFNSVVHLHHVPQHLDHVVVVRLKVQNHLLHVIMQIIAITSVHHHRRRIIQVHHHQNVAVEKAVMLIIMADVFVPFAQLMSKRLNVFLVYSIIATMSCKFFLNFFSINFHQNLFLIVVMNASFHGNDQNIVMLNPKGKRKTSHLIMSQRMLMFQLSGV